MLLLNLLNGCWSTTHKRTSLVSRWTDANRIVIDDTTSGAHTARSDTRIAASLIHTGLMQRTLVAVGALRPTGGRNAKHTVETGADRLTVMRSALGVWSARRRLTCGLHFIGLSYGCALSERVALESGRTRAHGDVVEHFATGVRGAGTRTRVSALVSNARLRSRALGAEYALGMATRVWITDKTGCASAHSCTGALSVGCARRRIARIFSLRGFLLNWWGQLASGERIANVAIDARADRHMVGHMASSVLAARARTRIGTALPDAGQLAGTILSDGALRPACGRSTDVGGQAGTRRRAVLVATLRVRTALTRIARIPDVDVRWSRLWRRRRLLTASQRVANETGVAYANR